MEEITGTGGRFHLEAAHSLSAVVVVFILFFFYFLDEV